MFIVLFVMILINISITFLAIYLYKKKMFVQYNRMLQRLDRVLAGKRLDTVYDESLDSAISERLNRIIELTEIQTGRAESERDIVKSLISDISHQIRTPLANITLYIGLLKEEIAEEKAIRLSDKIEKNAEKLDSFMKDLIKSSYAEQELISVTPRYMEVDELIKKGCQYVELEALKKNIQIDAEYHGYMGYADPKWTEEAIGNIIENAVKYSPEGTSVRVDSIQYETFVCIQIKDNGIGIPEEEQGKVFQRFYRASNIRDKQGYGIGLYLAREVLRRQQGYIKLKSVQNKGTTVEVFLLKKTS
ncbi:sensor histidine kinase [Lactonifactor longoviformis]|nr:sensor histidine kinase [Lactonifactor longoviformis]